MSSSFTLLIWADNGVIASEQFGHWVSTQEAIQTCRELYPEAIALMHRDTANILWQDAHAVGAMS